MWDRTAHQGRPRKSSLDRTNSRRSHGFVSRTVAAFFGWRTSQHRRGRYSTGSLSLPLHDAGGLGKEPNWRLVSLAVAAFFSLAGLYFFRNSSVIQPGDYPLPPLYRYYHDQELALPQHDPTLPYPEGSHAKFLWLPNYAHSKDLRPYEVAFRT